MLERQHPRCPPVAMIDASQKEGDGDRCELKAAQKMISKHEDLTNTVITAAELSAKELAAFLPRSKKRMGESTGAK